MNDDYIELKVGELMEQPDYAGLFPIKKYIDVSTVYFGIIEYLIEKDYIDEEEK